MTDEDLGPLPPGLRQESMPTHVAVIMDGNRRWDPMRSLPTGSGYEAGFLAFTRVDELELQMEDQGSLGLFFSCDNGSRPKNVRISHIGDNTLLPKSLQELLSEAVETTKNNSQLHLILALNYSGRNNLVQACHNIVPKVKDGLIEPKDIDKPLLERELETKCTEFPNADLLIPTSGELRISDFLLWQLAYTELYFANLLWPDFGEDEFVKALSSSQQRQRRYGG